MVEATNLHNFYNSHTHTYTCVRTHTHTQTRTHTHTHTLQLHAKTYFVNYGIILTINHELSAGLDKIVLHLSIFILSSYVV